MSSKKVCFVSLGCDKNLVDSEKTLKLLADAGYVFTDEPAEAELLVLNTCAFIKDALRESIDTLIELAELKKSRVSRPPRLVVMGCMAERYRDGIKEEFPEVDIIIGTNSWQDIIGYLNEAKVPERDISANVFAIEPQRERILTTGGHYAYLKIAEGCGKNCTYCAIPLMRGRYRSVPMEDLIDEASVLAGDGVRELILVAQETTLYGVDIYGEKYLPRLLRELSAIEGLRWIRLLYCYPEEIGEELINALCQLKKVVKYIDIPIQSASDHILRRMGRRTRRAEIEELIGRLREEIPGIALRTTFITGFPGETLKDHEETLSFIESMRFERLGVFTYSREEGTLAAGYSHQVPEKEKERRRGEIMSLQQRISEDKNQALIGRRMEVIVEGRLPDEGDIYVGRTYMDAPDVDGLIYFSSGRFLMTGDFVDVRVSKAYEYDLIGEIV